MPGLFYKDDVVIPFCICSLQNDTSQMINAYCPSQHVRNSLISSFLSFMKSEVWGICPGTNDNLEFERGYITQIGVKFSFILYSFRTYY